MGLQSFEDGLGRMVEGVFSRAFKSNVRPIEIGRRLIKEIDSNRTVDMKGRRVVPNQFVVRLAPDDRAALADIMGIEMERISVKATTSERLGFTGREEGIAAIATATLVKA